MIGKSPKSNGPLDLSINVNFSDRYSLYQAWLKLQGYPQEVSFEQEQEILASSSYEAAKFLDGTIIALSVGTAIYLLRDIIIGCVGILVLLGALGGFISFLNECFQSSFQKSDKPRVFGFFTYHALLIGRSKAYEANRPPTIDKIDFDSIDVLEPIIRASTRSLMSQVDARLRDIRTTTHAQTKALLGLRELTVRIMDEVNHAPDERWRVVAEQVRKGRRGKTQGVAQFRAV